MGTNENYYTVTVLATYFVSAINPTDARDIVYEAMLGTDPKNILSGGEINFGGMVIQEGTHYTISHGDKEPF